MSRPVRKWLEEDPAGSDLTTADISSRGSNPTRAFIKRREARRFLNTSVLLHWRASDGRMQSVRGRTVDISAIGIGVELATPPAVVQVSFTIPDLNCSGLARVCYIHVAGASGYRVGLELDGDRIALPDEEVPAPSAEDWLSGQFW